MRVSRQVRNNARALTPELVHRAKRFKSSSTKSFQFTYPGDEADWIVEETPYMDGPVISLSFCAVLLENSMIFTTFGPKDEIFIVLSPLTRLAAVNLVVRPCMRNTRSSKTEKISGHAAKHHVIWLLLRPTGRQIWWMFVKKECLEFLIERQLELEKMERANRELREKEELRIMEEHQRISSYFPPPCSPTPR